MRTDASFTLPAYSFANEIEGSRGTVVLGNGIPALVGEVTAIRPDHIVFHSEGRVYVIPLAAIVYYRYADED